MKTKKQVERLAELIEVQKHHILILESKVKYLIRTVNNQEVPNHELNH